MFKQRMNMDIQSIAAQFRIEGEFVQALRYGSGHIHDTYCMTVRRGNREIPFLLQRVNNVVFKNIPILMENMVRVTDHLRVKCEASGLSPAEISRRVLRVIPTKDDASFYRDEEGNFWRIFDFISGAHTYDVVESEPRLFQAARAFGLFLAMLRDFPPPPLHDSIPAFHDGCKRMAAFQKALETDVFNRAKTAEKEIDFAWANKGFFDIIPDLLKHGKLPLRVTHNDTKINNVLIDDVTGEGICVIDLDTVMPGVAPYDFGDLGRTALSPTDEDERDLSKIAVQMPRFAAILNGYLTGAGVSLSRTEKEYLVFGIKMITQLIGVRFLTDYLLGDVYFKVQRPGHNLDRCRTQFKLVQSVIGHEEEMIKLVNSFV